VVPALASALLLACAAGDAAPRPHNLRGTVMPEPIEKADFTLLDTEGEPFEFRARTDGQLTLLFFGYTHCPDVCPVHLANIAGALRRLPYEQRQQVSVVFVTTDPERDTPERVRRWLDSFDRSFVGLRGPVEEVNAIQQRMKLGAAYVMEGTEGTLPDSAGYLVAHAGQVLAFSPSDDLAHVAYPFGARQADWSHDIPILLELLW
jgi:protein SCO1/2